MISRPCEDEQASLSGARLPRWAWALGCLGAVGRGRRGSWAFSWPWKCGRWYRPWLFSKRVTMFSVPSASSGAPSILVGPLVTFNLFSACEPSGPARSSLPGRLLGGDDSSEGPSVSAGLRDDWGVDRRAHDGIELRSRGNSAFILAVLNRWCSPGGGIVGERPC